MVRTRELKIRAEPLKLPVLPLRDVVVFPHMVIPLFVGRARSIHALDMATNSDKKIFLVAQKDAKQEDPLQDDLYSDGCIANILQMLKLPDGTVKVLVEGQARGTITNYIDEEPALLAEIAPVIEKEISEGEMDVLNRTLLSEFEQYVKYNKKIPPEILTSLGALDHPGRLADSITAHMALKVVDKQKILEARDLEQRVEELIATIETEIDLLKVEDRIRGRVKQQMEKKQREYYLTEQLAAIQKEMGQMGAVDELDELAKKIEQAGMPEDAREKADAELNKLRSMPPMSAEASVSRNYLDALVTVPWTTHSEINNDLTHAESVLEKDHYGLKEVKERIIEHLAVQLRVKKLKGPVLCLVGPPGVGKTSLGESIARATGREFVRISLGGVRDEAEIRGHRRTYIGALPGKIIQKLMKVKVRNPLFMLDEVDKMAMDFRGDPASALLEVLDPEQNDSFNDHYLEVDYDLSDVMFICTANSLNIPPALLDRMEVIRIPGYTEDEKINIAERHLIPKQLERNGLKAKELTFSEGALRDIVRHYSREAGVRNFERDISKICRKVVRALLTKRSKGSVTVTQRNLEKYLGVEKYRYGVAEEFDQVGQVTGLGWTEVGGELLTVEATAVPGTGKMIYTGHLGDVMQESIQAALTVVRARSRLLGIAPDFHQLKDIHVHVPEGATPKDGPSAGVAMVTALVSALSQIPVKSNVAMTGEITLRGEVLPIGGLKEKLLAAHRGNIKTVIIPRDNFRELKEIPENITKELNIKPVRWVDEVLSIALQHLPHPLPEDTAAGDELKMLRKRTPRKKENEHRTH